MFIVTTFITTKSIENPNVYQLINREIRYIHKIEYYLVIKRKYKYNVMNLKNITLSERRASQVIQW